MGRKVTIEVTDDDISEGIAGACNQCPIAIAAKRAKVADIVSVGGFHMYVRNGYHRHPDLVALPIEAMDFIAAFDSDQPVEPFSFEIEVPDVIE